MDMKKIKPFKEEIFTLKDVINWCDQKVEQGHTLKLVWEGGHDEGWVHLHIDDTECYDKEADFLIDKMENVLEYGGFATEYSINGSAVYDSTTKTFIGYTTEDYEECAYHNFVSNPIYIKIPKKFKYRGFSIIYNVCDFENLSFEFLEHSASFKPFMIIDIEQEEKFIDAITSFLKKEMKSRFDEKIENSDLTDTEMHCDYIYEYEKIIDDEYFHILEINSLRYYFNNEKNLEIELNLFEILEEENETLKT